MVLEYIIIHIPVGDSPPDLATVGLPCRFIRIQPIGDLVDTDMDTDMVIDGVIIMDTIMDTGPDTLGAGTIQEMYINKGLPEFDPQQEIACRHKL